MTGIFKRLDEISQGLARLAGELKQCMEDVKLVSAREIDRFEQDRTSTLLAASVDSQVEGDQVSLHNVEETDSKKVGWRYNMQSLATMFRTHRTLY